MDELRSNTIPLIVDWHYFIVNAKDLGQSSNIFFERMCYLIFCIETGNLKGVEKYKNHADIETKPQLLDGILTGFQAKFYEVSLGQKKEEILSFIKGTKGRYPDIQQIIIFTNQEHTSGRAKNSDSKYLTSSEALAKSFDIKLIWRTNGFFESPEITFNPAIRECIQFFVSQDRVFANQAKNSFKLIQNEVSENNSNHYVEDLNTSNEEGEAIEQPQFSKSRNLNNIFPVKRTSTITHKETTIKEVNYNLENTIKIIGDNKSTKDLVTDLKSNLFLQLEFFNILFNGSHDNKVYFFAKSYVDELMDDFENCKDNFDDNIVKKVRLKYIFLLNKLN